MYVVDKTTCSRREWLSAMLEISSVYIAKTIEIITIKSNSKFVNTRTGHRNEAARQRGSEATWQWAIGNQLRQPTEREREGSERERGGRGRDWQCEKMSCTSQMYKGKWVKCLRKSTQRAASMPELN